MPALRTFVRLLVGAGVLVSMSAHAVQWRGSMDQASRNAAAYMISPQGKVAGLAYSLDPVATGWKLNRSGTALQQLPLPFNQGPYSPLRPASAYGISGNPAKAAVIDVPANVKVPGKSTTLPVRIVEPVAKSTLAKAVLKTLPLVGNAMAVAELLEEAGLLFQDDRYYQVNQSTTATVSDGFRYTILRQPPITNNWYPSKEAACTAIQTYHKWDISYVDGNICRVRNVTTGIVSSYQIYGERSNCPAGHYIVGAQCLPQSPTEKTPIPVDTAASILASGVPDDKLIDAVNNLPDDPNVIDVIARELQNDPADEEFRWPSSLPTPPSTINVGDPVATTITNPDGSTVTTTTATTATINGDQITFDTKTTTVTRDAAGNVTGTTNTTTNPTHPGNPNNPQPEIITCGLPDTPPCKIDEEGTPKPPADDGENTFRGLVPNCLKEDWKTCFPELPDINWSFSLPSGCSAIPVPFGKYGLSEVNICPWQSMIHDIMSMLWAAAGLFGAIGILSGRRNSES